MLKKHTKSQVCIIIKPSNHKNSNGFLLLKQNGAPVGFALLRAVKTVTSIVVIYNVLSHHAEFLAPPKLTPDSEAICPATERLSRTTGQWDGSCLTQCFPRPTLFASNLRTVRGSEERTVSKDDIISEIPISANTVLLSNTL